MRLTSGTGRDRSGWLALGALMALVGAAPRASVPSRPSMGSLQGQVLLSPRIAARRPRFRLYNEYGTGAVVPPANSTASEMANVVVYLDSAIPGLPAGESAGRVKQVNESFVPHVLAVPAGATVEFPNEDAFFHNVFSLSRARTFDLGRFAQGASKSVTFERSGIVQIFCHIHSDMSAVILVAPSRYYATPDSLGHFVIGEIPPGTYRFTAWHERARPITATVTIPAEGSARVDFNIPLPDVPATSAR